jgi:hypothetical protein
MPKSFTIPLFALLLASSSSPLAMDIVDDTSKSIFNFSWIEDVR